MLLCLRAAATSIRFPTLVRNVTTVLGRLTAIYNNTSQPQELEGKAAIAQVRHKHARQPLRIAVAALHNGQF